MEYLKQNYRLTDDDLVEVFYTYNTTTGLNNPPQSRYSPYWVRYEILKVGTSGESERYGSMFRLPVEVSTGVFRPNFIVGFDWDTGGYILRWKYMDSENSDVVYREKQFTVLTEGVYNTHHEIVKGYIDLPAELTIID